MTRLTVFECPGTNVEASLTGTMQFISPDEISENLLYKGLDTTVFNYIFIQGYSNQIKPILPSVEKGVEIVGEYIKAGSGPFALVGTSQGAMIMSMVYKKLVSGELPRLADCVGVFLIANPAREQGKSIPGGSVSPGHGIVPEEYRLTGTINDLLVWEFAHPDDPVCSNFSGRAGDPALSEAREAAFTSLLTTFDGSLDEWNDFGQIFQDVLGLFTLAAFAGPRMLLYHSDYDNFFPIPGDGRNTFQVLIDHLNTIVGPVYRDDGWSTVIRMPTL